MDDHYYPFGLTMAGISSKASGKLENRYKFNGGNEFQSKEFSDGTGLEMYDATNRMYDPQLGRFGQVDELAEVALGYSPYSFSYNNPIRFNDPLGLEGEDFTGRKRKKEKRTEGTGAGNEQEVLDNVTVTARHSTQNLKNTYWSLRGQGVSFESVKDRGLRNWLTNYDRSERWLHELHLQQRKEELTALEYASWLAPAGEFMLSARLGKIALRLFALKRGSMVLFSGGADLTAQLITQNGNLKNINPVSTISSALLANPLIGSIPGAMINLSPTSINNNTIFSSIYDPNVFKSILLSTVGNLGADKFGSGLKMEFGFKSTTYAAETVFGTASGTIDQITTTDKK
ncbi:RHS repeat-associated core domain-containing protein [Flavihumibacter profundi]|uniref:RHS repeat-associated core domain-containing protein n=1 Tax=Flavihumibacter profundi TaxID=2716883 RepID=UPI001CC82211|nr:RHS repeat-associated core domain-containing protein [Flavihumibacter profundi]MBZ5858574.1 RHS repeat-associated core domain-containing protein [Flavihumibacter profundi]